MEKVILPAFEAYTQLNGDCHDMKSIFIVPHCHPYPESTWGLQLGKTKWNIQNQNAFASDYEKKLVHLQRLGVK